MVTVLSALTLTMGSWGTRDTRTPGNWLEGAPGHGAERRLPCSQMSEHKALFTGGHCVPSGVISVC